MGIPEQWLPQIAKDIGAAYDSGGVPSAAMLEELAAGWGFQGDGIKSAVITMSCLMCFRPRLITTDERIIPDERTFENFEKWSGYKRGVIRETLRRLIWNGILAVEGMAVQWPDDETDTSTIIDCLVGAGIMRRYAPKPAAQAAECKYFAQTDAQGTPLPVVKTAALTLGTWSVVKAVQEAGFEFKNAITIAFNGWLGVPVPANCCQPGYMSYGRVCSHMRRVKHLPTIPPEIVVAWGEALYNWNYFKELNNEK